MFIYERLKDCREDEDLTQTKVGEILGIDQRVYLIGLTNGKNPYPRKKDNIH